MTLCYSELARSSNAVRTKLTEKQVAPGLGKQLLSNEISVTKRESLQECRNAYDQLWQFAIRYALNPHKTV